jgi:ferredoxin
MRTRVWIDQDLCTGDGLCAEIAPLIFAMGDDGLAYVRNESGALLPAGHTGLAEIPDGLEDCVHDAIAECPGECIFLHHGD